MPFLQNSAPIISRCGIKSRPRRANPGWHRAAPYLPAHPISFPSIGTPAPGLSSVSDSLLGAAGTGTLSTSAAEVWAGVSDAVCVAGSVFAGTTAGVGVYADFERLSVLPAAAERLRKAVA